MHEAAIMSAKYFDEVKTASKVRRQDLTLQTLEDMIGKELDKVLYKALKEQLPEYDGDTQKAFRDEFRKPAKEGNSGPVVRSIKILRRITTSVSVRGGITKNRRMVRIDIYWKNGKYYAVPYYVSGVAKK